MNPVLKITIKGSAKEIAALAQQLQERHEERTVQKAALSGLSNHGMSYETYAAIDSSQSNPIVLETANH